MRFVRGLASLLVLVVALVGIPFGLWSFGTVGLPGGLPAVGDLLDAALRPDDGTLLLAALTVLGWVAWASFALAVVVDVPAHLRGLPAPHLPGLGLQQRAASALVGAVIVLLLGGMAASPATATVTEDPGRAPVASSSSDVVDDVRSAEGDGGSAAPVPDAEPVEAAAPARSTVTVQPGDSLWSLASIHLGDGMQWRVIGEANLGVAQADGGALGDDWAVQPGWQLVVPGLAATDAGAGDTSGPAGQERADLDHVVVPGDTLSEIAQDHLGDADRWPELAEATAGTLQPDGTRLVDPDLIHPGWTVTVPGAGEPVPSVPADGGAPAGDVDDAPVDADVPQPSEGAVGDPTAADDDAAGTALGRDVVGQDVIDQDPAAQDLAAQDRDAQDLAAEDLAAQDLAADDGAEVGLQTPAGIGGLLAAAVVVLLGSRRRSARDERDPGTRLLLPAEGPGLLEREVRELAATVDTVAMERALRDLARRLAASGRPLPAVRAARLSREDLELYLVEATTLPAPWTEVGDKTVWSVAFADVDPETPVRRIAAQLGMDLLAGDELAPVPEVGPVPYPGLVNIGDDDEGGHVLLDLVELAGLVVVGEQTATVEVLSALAVELAAGRGREDVGVTLVGFGAELATAVPGGLRHVPDVARLLVELEARETDVGRVLDDAGVDSVAQARRAGLGGEVGVAEIVLLGDPADSARHVDALRHVVADLPRFGVSTVVAALDGSDAAGLGAGTWQLHLEPAGPTQASEQEGTARRWAVLQPAGLSLVPQRLPLPEARAIARLSGADGVTTGPGPAWGSALAAGEPDVADLPIPVGRGAAAGTTPPERADAVPAVRLPVAEDLYGGPAPVVQLFGPVRVHNAGGPSPASHTARATALVAYLAAAGSPRTRSQVAAALSPSRRLTEQTVHALASRARRWLGEDATGQPYLPRAVESGAYRVHPEVTTDWDRWQALLGEDVRTTPLEVLVAALELAGEPFVAVVERHYTWAEQLREDMVAGVVDVAHEAARRATRTGATDLARRAVRAGMAVDPAAEVLWRDLLRLEHQAGRAAVVAAVVRRVQVYADDLGVALQPQTEALIAEVSGTVPGAAADARARHRRVRARAIGL